MITSEALLELFDARLQQYQTTTGIILQAISNVTEGVLEALAEEESSTLEWEDVQFVPGEVDDLVVLIGAIQLAIDEHVQLENGKEIQVTEENVDTFRRIVRVGIPLDLAVNGAVEDITTFFEDKRETNYTTLSDISEMEVLEEIEEKDPHRQAIETIIGFDTDGLSDEQIRQLIFNEDEGKVH